MNNAHPVKVSINESEHKLKDEGGEIPSSLLQQHYRLIKLIGQGGFGKTFLAVDEAKSPPSPCVVKELFCHQFPLVLEKAQELFLQEAQLLEKLGQHPQIPDFWAYFQENQSSYLVQEFIAGNNLATIVQEQGAFSEPQIWKVLEDVLPVLKFIHDHQVIHRDIKPENLIRRNSDSQLFLVDFGAAKQVRQVDLLSAETSIGSAEYVAPEQARGKAVFASDLYSLGISCVYLLTGIHPFDLFDVTNGCWAWRQYLQEDVSDNLAEILDQLIQNALNHRFQSADEVIAALRVAQLSRDGFNPAISIPTENYSQPDHQHPATTIDWQCQHILTGHSGLFASVNAVVFSPDGQLLASGSDDKTIHLWDMNTGQLINIFQGHNHFVKSLTFSSDGQLLASGSDDKTIRLWNINTNQTIRTFSGHTQAIRSVAFSPVIASPAGISQILASGSSDKTIKLWDIKTGEVIHTLTGHQLQVTAVAFSPNRQILATASFDRTVRLWKLPAADLHESIPAIQHILVSHSRAVTCLAFSPDGDVLATGGDDNTINVWNPNTGKLLRTFSGHSWSVAALTFSQDGEILVSSSWDKTIKLWEMSTGRDIGTLFGHTDSVGAVNISCDHPCRIASGSKDKTVRVWQRVP